MTDAALDTAAPTTLSRGGVALVLLALAMGGFAIGGLQPPGLAEMVLMVVEAHAGRRPVHVPTTFLSRS